MRRLGRSGPSPAIVVAALALVAALAGTALAGSDASTSAINKKKVKKIARKQAVQQINELAPGLSVAEADTATNATNATSAERAQTFNPNATLRSGETLSGVWAVAGGMGNTAVTAVQFTPQLPSALGAGAVHRIVSGGSSPDCPGPGEARPGHLCLYEVTASNVSFNVISDPGGGPAGGAGRRGAAILYNANMNGAFAKGTWSVTAP